MKDKVSQANPVRMRSRECDKAGIALNTGEISRGLHFDLTNYFGMALNKSLYWL